MPFAAYNGRARPIVTRCDYKTVVAASVTGQLPLRNLSAHGPSRMVGRVF
jgi:hypothetical protein